jgi:hypothetical protein
MVNTTVKKNTYSKTQLISPIIYAWQDISDLWSEITVFYTFH